MLTPDEQSLLRLYKSLGYQNVIVEGDRDRLLFTANKQIQSSGTHEQYLTAEAAKCGYCSIRRDQFTGLEKFRPYKLGDLLNG